MGGGEAREEGGKMAVRLQVFFPSLSIFLPRVGF